MPVLNMNYVIITPAKNEAQHLPILAKCILNQSLLPNAWIIIDDGSTDDTIGIANKLAAEYPWIYYTRLDTPSKCIIDKNASSFEFGFSRAVKKGFDYVQLLSNERPFAYDFLGKIDADLKVPPNFFESLLNKFQSNPKLGVCGGSTGGKHLSYLAAMPGGAYLIKRECFVGISDIHVSMDIDLIISIKAKLRGWETKVFPDILFSMARVNPIWSGNRAGLKAYVLSKPPIAIFWEIAQFILTKRFYVIPIFLTTYYTAFFRKEKKIIDKDVLYYYRYLYSRELIRAIYNELIHFSLKS